MKAKTYIILTGLFLLPVFNSYGQHMEYGITGGMDISLFNMSNIPSQLGTKWVYNPIIGFNLNGTAEFKGGDSWGISLEPGFIQKGGTQLFYYTNLASGNTTDYHVVNRLNYIQLPLLYNMYLTDNFCLSVGGEYSYLIHSNSELTRTPNNIDNSVQAFDATQDQPSSRNISNSFTNRHEISGIAGISYAVTDAMDVRLRYSYGASELASISWMDHLKYLAGISQIRNQYLQLSLKYKLKY